MKKRNAFTLAEVLITLILVGVVAALTVPFLINEFNKDKWVIAYKRSFAEAYNTLGKMALEEDCAKNLTCTHVFDGGQAESTKKFGDKMSKQLAIFRNCGVEDDSCFAHNIRLGLSKSDSEDLKATMADSVTFVKDDPSMKTGFYTFITTRGVSYALLSFGLSCLNNATTPAEKTIINEYLDAYVTPTCRDVENKNTDCQMLSLCGFIIIDANGPNPPNIWGRDVFGMWVTDRSVLGIYPFGGEGDAKFGGQCHFATESQSDTRGCAAQLIKDGWKMKY